MKPSLRTFPLVAAFIIGLSTSAQAARTFTSVTIVPALTNISAGIPTNVLANIAVRNGSGGSTRFVGTAQVTATVMPSEPTITANVTGTNFVFPNTDTTYNYTLSVTTTALTPSNTYVIKVVADTNNPPVPDNITPVTNTFTITMATGGPFNPAMVWTPAGANTNWSTSGNWSPPGPPGLANDAQFFDGGAVATPGTINNVVDTSSTVGSLTFGQTNNSHTTFIASGRTLTLGAINGLAVGTGTDPGDSVLPSATITGTGGAVLVTNRAAVVNVGQAHPTVNNAISQSRATLDMSGLDSFTATVSRLLVGVDVTLRGSAGVLNLAKTNTITATAGSTAPQLDIGDNSQASGTPTIPSSLLLGQTNALFADSIAVGRGKTDNTGALMAFNSVFASPSALFRGTNGGASRVGTWFIGDGFGSRTYYTFGTCDFTLGTVDALVDTMYVGRGASTVFGAGANNPGTGTLTLGPGTVDVNTLEVGYSTANASGTGTINVNGGNLVVNSLLELAHASLSAGTLNVANGTATANTGVIAGSGTATLTLTNATLNVTNSAATIGTALDPINTLNVNNSTIKLAVQSIGPSANTANLTSDGAANTISISSVPLLTGFPTQFPIIQYGLNAGSASGDLTKFVLGAMPPATPAYGAYISNNVANNSIDLVITNGPIVPSLTWDGVPTGNWDTSTANWRPKGGGPDTTYGQGNFVTFNDTLTGTSSVNLTTTLSPASVTVSNNNVNYLFGGTGKLSGTMNLIKSGTGTFTLGETGGDNFSGGIIVENGTVILANASAAMTGNTTINGGTVQIGNNDSKGSLPSGNVIDSGALVFNRADNIAVSNAIAGAGTLTQNNTNTVILSGNSSFSGAVTVSQGTLQVGTTNGIGSAASVTVSSGATFDVGGIALFGNGNSGLTVTAAGSGFGGAGAIINTGTSQARVLHSVTLAGDTTFGGMGDWDIRNSTGSSAPADAQLSGAYNLTKVGTNTVSFRGVVVDSGLGNIDIQAGGLTFTATASAPLASLGDANATASVSSNATLTLDTIGTVPGKKISLNNGATLKSSGTNTVGSSVTLSGAANNTVSVGTGAQLTITTGITGAGGFSKNGSGPLFLSAGNSYGGNTVVSGGTLALYGGGSDGSISSSVNINVTGGAVLDVSGRSDGTLTLAPGQTLNGGAGTNGPGTVNGALIASASSVVAPGTSPTNIGSLTVSATSTFHGSTVMKLSPATATNDRLNANAITYGGSLLVTNIQGNITNGQTFQLFFATNGIYNAGSFSSVTLPSSSGLSWANNLAVNGSIAAIAILPPYITSISLSGSSLVIRGTNGTPGQQFTTLTSTNIVLPLSQWTPIATNTFNGASFSVTNTVTSSAPQNFFALRVP
jgi:autotransporter-associated beta strand protein